MLRMEVPIEIFESAIEACDMVDEKGQQTRLAMLLGF